MAESFEEIYSRAAARKGGAKHLELLLSCPRTSDELLKLSDNDWLEEFTRKIFQSGFYWSVINNKWPGFREVFWQFDVNKLVLMPPEMLEKCAEDERIVRNYKKVMTVPVNASMIHFFPQDHGVSFTEFVANWPSDDIIGLWSLLKKHGARLGGNTGPYALRALGKDTFLLSRDVEAYLRAHKVIDGGLQSKKSLAAIQAFFNALQEESGRSLQEISQLIAYGVGDNHVGLALSGVSD